MVNNDQQWWAMLHDFYQRFKYQTIMTEDIVTWFNQRTRMNLAPVFNQYLRHTAIPTLELKFNEDAGTVAYRWKTDEPNFAMPVRVGTKAHWQVIRPTNEWQSMKTSLKKDAFAVATDLYFVDVSES
jgi:aminopeptidase N